MKVWSKEALVLGGIYSVLNAPLSLLRFEIISTGLFWFFLGSALMLCFNKTPKYLSLLVNNYPKTSYYLASFGWIPYAVLIITTVVFGGVFFVKYTEDFIVSFLYCVGYAGLAFIFISLLIAFMKARKASSL